MKLPLLVGARPRAEVRGPVVNLSKGQWRVTVKDLVDTILRFYCHSPFSSVEIVHGHGSESIFIGPCRVWVTIEKVGTEDNIHVYAELSNVN